MEVKLPLKLLRFATVQLKALKFVVKEVKSVFIVFKADRFVLLSAFNEFIASTISFQLWAVRVSHSLTVSKSGKLNVA
jgi:hypothetical protein